MPYMLLIVEPIGQRAQRSEQAGHAAYDSMLRYAADLKARGLLRDAQSLKSEAEGVKLQVRDSRPRLIDGPYAEAKEMIGGFFLLDCATRDEAVEIAAQCPAAQWCTVEIREVGPCFS